MAVAPRLEHLFRMIYNAIYGKATALSDAHGPIAVGATQTHVMFGFAETKTKHE